MPSEDDVIVLGAGVAGLAAAYALTRAGCRARVLEGAEVVGGLARTHVHGTFRFDLGGHRFLTQDVRIERLVRELLGEELVVVRRRSQIRLRGRWIDYPLRPRGALAGLGVRTSAAILLGYSWAQLAQRLHPAPLLSLEDWVVAHFGRPMFELYFRDYSEKVWGLPCREIAAEWIARRIDGLSLGAAIRRALARRAPDLPTLTDQFLYPRRGTGRIAERLAEEITRANSIVTGARVLHLRYARGRVDTVVVRQGERTHELSAPAFVSTLPLPRLVQMLQPCAPREILEDACGLRYRDLVLVTLMIGRARVTDQSWIYFPEQDVPFGRLHEPTNWSADMAPPGQTLLVTERFCFRGDVTWSAPDAALIDETAGHLERLGFLRRAEVIDGVVLRIPSAYPVFELGYRARCERIEKFVAGFENLHLAGRGGMFRYYNMDHALASGLAAAEAAWPGAPAVARAAAAGG